MTSDRPPDEYSRRFVFRVATILLFTAMFTASACLGSIGLRLGVGAEVMPLKYIDLKKYNTGTGCDIRADVVWGAFSATSLEIGYREFSFGGSTFELRRFGLIQRFYPLYFRNPGQSPYLGLGFTAANRDRFSMDVPNADYGGLLALIGIEISIGRCLHIDPAVRWDFFNNTDYFYSGVGLGFHLVWKLN